MPSYNRCFCGKLSERWCPRVWKVFLLFFFENSGEEGIPKAFGNRYLKVFSGWALGLVFSPFAHPAHLCFPASASCPLPSCQCAPFTQVFSPSRQVGLLRPHQMDAPGFHGARCQVLSHGSRGPAGRPARCLATDLGPPATSVGAPGDPRSAESDAVLPNRPLLRSLPCPLLTPVLWCGRVDLFGFW